MRYPRTKPSIVMAAVAAIAVASPVVVGLSDQGPVPVDNQREHTPTEITQLALADLPMVALDVASSGLGDLGIKLPEIDPNLFLVPGLGIPTPQAPPTSPAPGMNLPDLPELPEKKSPDGNKTPDSQKPETEKPRADGDQAEKDQAEKDQAEKDQADTNETPRMADGRPVGAAVGHIVEDSPLKMVALNWDAPLDAAMYLRSKHPEDGWTDWIELERLAPADNSSSSSVSGTEPVWVGDAREVQFTVASADGVAIPASEPREGGDAQVGIGTADAVVGKLLDTALNTLKATLISPESLLSLGQSLLTQLLGGPQVISRAQWGADESIRCSQPRVSPDVKGAIVHHTAGNNDYSPEQSAEIVRGIYAYHARTLGWCDIGYNVLVDKYGQIFEGTFGGLDRNVEGVHTGGFNKSTVGLAMIGNLDIVAPTPQMIQSSAKFLRWRLNKGGINPLGSAALYAEPFSDSKYPSGAVANMPAISAHRDLNNTLCPGVYGYQALDTLRALVAGAPPAAPEPAPEEGGPAPEGEPAPEQAPAEGEPAPVPAA